MSYSVLAKYYDRFMIDFPYTKWGEFIISKLDVVKPTIELACGTGNLTIELFTKGVNIDGSDIDLNMLSIAKQKASDNHLDLDFFLNDMVKADLSSYHNIICCCDGINSLLLEHVLREFFTNIAKNLQGIFIFDFSTKEKLKSLDGQIYYEDYEDITYFWESEYDSEADQVSLNLVFFEKLDNGYYNREDVIINQKSLSIPLVTKILKDSNLVVEGIYDDYTNRPATDSSHRVVIVCKKKL